MHLYLLRLVPIFLFVVTSCSYRFTNKHIIVPYKLKTIAVAAIYDTSRSVIPHEILWNKVQTAIVKDGHLRLTARANADAILKLHIKKSNLVTKGAIESRKTTQHTFKKYEKKVPLAPSLLKPLSKLNSYRTYTELNFVVEAKIYHLYTRKMIFNKTYFAKDEFKTFTNDLSTIKGSSFTSHPNVFLRFQESMYEKFKQQSELIANNIIRDFLIR